MMGYNEVAKQELNILGDPFKGGRNKLRPLFPRPYLSPPNHDIHPSRPTNHLLPSSLSTATTTTTTHHHHHNQSFGGREEVKAETTVGTNQVMVSSRWNPMPEQLGALEELYRRGTRTPSADQIQHITSQLRRYGKIEGKNVFYWFQNHKARERQKRRRHLLRPTSPHSSGNGNGGSKIGIETTEQKSCKWAPSSTNKESELPIQKAETTGATKAETSSTSSDIGCFQFHETSHQFQPHHHHHHHKPLHNNNTNDNNIKNLLLFFKGDNNATWHTENTTATTTMLQTSSSCSACSYPTPSVFPFPLSSSEPTDLNQSPVSPVLHGDDGGGETPQSPTLQHFPVALIREDGQNNNHAHNSSHLDDDDDDDDDHDDDHDDEMKKVEEEEEGGEEKSDYYIISGNEKVVNNPFPYYQFL